MYPGWLDTKRAAKNAREDQVTLTEHRLSMAFWFLLALTHAAMAGAALLGWDWKRALLMSGFIIGDLGWALWNGTKAERMLRAANER
jgi:hypothetical protein